MDSAKPLALVTGASSGIGAAFARRLASVGYRLILVARRRDRLEAFARELGDAEPLPADLTRPADLEAVASRIHAAPDLDLLVNNAGFGSLGRFFEIPVEGQLDMHRLHVLATVRLTHAALAVMVPRRKGAVINVASVAGFGASPGSVSYCATKAWMNTFSEGLYFELKSVGSPVKIQALCPGFTYTEFHDVIGMDRRGVPSRLWMRPEAIVDASLRGLERDRLYVIPGVVYKAAARAMRWMPLSLRRVLTLRYARAAGRDQVRQKA
jgi:short-subunit dehydrogenase